MGWTVRTELRNPICRNWSDNTVVFVETDHSLNFVYVDGCFALSIYRCVLGGTSLTGLPVLPAENTAVGLYNIQGQVINHTSLSMLCHVDVGQAVQAEDVALLSVLVDTGEGQTCRSQCRSVCTGAVPQASLLHWCTMDVYTSPRKQQRQQRTVLHGKDEG